MHSVLEHDFPRRLALHVDRAAERSPTHEYDPTDPR